MGSSAGGAFLPNDPPPSTGQVLTSPTITSPTITGTTSLGAGATLTTPTITAPAISGATTVASGATITTPTILFTTAAVTSTGVTGSDGTALGTVTPILATLTGASGSAVSIPTGAALAGAVYALRNINTTGVITVYAVGGTINGTTGTTGLALSPTGTKAAVLMCVTAGAWQVPAISAT